jgi:hypothetical protein
MHEGKYAEALSYYHRAADMAERLGNDTQLAAIFGNLAICHGRLGNYEEQLRFSSVAPRPWGGEFGGFVELQITYSHALSLTILGKLDEASVVIENLESRLCGSLPAWMRQAWFLWKADLQMCAGRATEAREIATQGFAEMGTELHSLGLPGPFARWLACLGRTGSTSDLARRALEPLLDSLTTLDALDQVEVLCAARRLGLHNSKGDLSERVIEERLQRLPREVANHLRRVGSLT